MRQRVLAAALFAGLATAAGAIAADSPVRSDPPQRVANEGTIGDNWTLAPGATLPAPVYPPHLAARGANACIALGYLIERDGTTSGFEVLKQWNSESGEDEPVSGFWEAFANAGADAVAQWRFQPRPGKVAVPTYTVATLGFEGGRTPGGAAANRHCRIGELADHLAQMKQRRQDRGDVVRQDLERARLRSREAGMEASLRRINNKP